MVGHRSTGLPECGPTESLAPEPCYYYYNLDYILLICTESRIAMLYELTHFCAPFQHLLSERLTSLGIMGAPLVPPLNPSETIVFRV